MSDLILPPAPAKIHFVGIGGIGMSGLARMLVDRGYRVSGSDSTESDLLADLERSGIAIWVGHDMTRQAAAADLVVRTAAVSLTNPEVRAAAAASVPTIKRSELLGALSRESICIAVAGSHGKSTTSAMIAWSLQHLGADPTYAIGAMLQETGANAGNGNGQHFVVEADEFDRSFLTLSPTYAVVTNIEFDHPDIFEDQSAYDDAFARFMSLVSPGGSLIVRHDDEEVNRVLSTIDDLSRDRIVTFGESRDADWTLAQNRESYLVTSPDGSSIDLRLQVPGWHNALNATAAMALLHLLGFDLEAISQSLNLFTGICRRFEIKGEVNDIVVIDDYAHHPTEIEATVKAARSRYPVRRIWSIFQPHTFSRTSALVSEFAGSLSLSDEVVVMDVFASREVDDGSVTENHLRQMAGLRGRRSSNNETTVEQLAPLLEPGDIVLTMGAGDITHLGPELLTQLSKTAERETS